MDTLLSLWRLPFYGLRWAFLGSFVFLIVVWMAPTPGCVRHAKASLQQQTVPPASVRSFESRKLASKTSLAAAKESEKPAVTKAPEAEVETAVASPVVDEKKEDVAIIFASVIMGISGLITLVSFPVYLFSGSKERSRKAGGTFKTAFTFLITSGGGLMAYLGFAV